MKRGVFSPANFQPIYRQLSGQQCSEQHWTYKKWVTRADTEYLVWTHYLHDVKRNEHVAGVPRVPPAVPGLCPLADKGSISHFRGYSDNLEHCVQYEQRVDPCTKARTQRTAVTKGVFTPSATGAAAGSALCDRRAQLWPASTTAQCGQPRA